MNLELLEVLLNFFTEILSFGAASAIVQLQQEVNDSPQDCANISLRMNFNGGILLSRIETMNV